VGAAVAGLESDVVFGHQRTTTAFACPGAICNPAITIAGFDAPVALVHQHNLDWFGTLRGRLGAAVTPDTLLYGTGGLAFGEVEHVGTIYGAGIAFDDNGNLFPVPAGNNFFSRSLRAGWTAGGGLEAHLGGNWTGKVEYLHVDLGRESTLAIIPANSTPIGIAFNSHITQDMVRLGINYKFDPYVAYVPVYPTPATPALERVRPVYKDPIETVWTWTGFYFGANAGYATGSFDTSTLYSDASMGTPLFGAQSSARLKGGIGGAQTGYNLQAGIWFAGLETDIQFSSQRNITTSLCPGAVCNPGIGFDAPVTLDQTHNLDWFGTVRGRLGVAVTPDVVAYGTGGLAVGGIAHAGTIGGAIGGVDANGNPTATSAPTNFISRSAKTGFVVGGGIETHLAGNVTGKIEYLHMSFGTDSAIGTNSQNTPPIAVALASHVTDDIVRLGLNYKFDPNGADAPVYKPASRSAAIDGPPLVLKAPVPWLWTWNGYYLGVNAGYSWGRSNTDAFFNDNTLATTFGTSSVDGVRGRVFGVQTGYNFQSGSWLWGVEADLQLTGQVGNPIFTCLGTICNPAGPVVAAFDQNQKVDWFGTLRQRFGGLVTPDLLLYVTGGAAVAGISTSGNVFGYAPNGNPAVNAFSNRSINAGWAAGGGVEAHLGGNWTGKTELHGLRLGQHKLNQPAEHDADRRVQFPHHRSAGPRRVELQIRPNGSSRGIRDLEGHGSSGAMDLGRLLRRVQRRLRHWQLRYGHAAQRCHDRQSAAVGERFFLQAARGDLWRSGRLQPCRRQLARRRRAGFPALEPTRKSDRRLPRGSLQSGARPCRCAGHRQHAAKLGMVQHAAGAPRRSGRPRHRGLFHRRLGSRPDQDVRHPERDQSHAHSRCHHGRRAPR
jgi:outer membrane immunogenic protein